MDQFRIHGTMELEAEMKNKPLALPAPENLQNTQSFQSFSENIGDTTASLKDNTALMKEFGNIMPEIIKNLRSMNDIVNKTNQNLPAIAQVKTQAKSKNNLIDDYNRQNLLQLVNTGGNVVQSVASGNVPGALISGVNGVASTANNLSKMAMTEDLAGLAKGLIAGGAIATIAATVIKGGDALANKFIESMPTIYGTGRAFGSMNDDEALRKYGQVNQFNKGTGLDIDTFQGIVQSLRTQGVGNGLSPEGQLAAAGSIARTTSRWAYATGGDANQYANLAGIMSRYGGSKNVESDFNYLVSAGKASGLNDTQIPEFLSGIQKVMEDGIAKGFSRSATEVADTMLMFSKLSGGNPFWQGEQGARIINQASNGLASATGLSKTSDIIAYRAIARAYNGREEEALGKDLYLKDGNYVNNMMLMEKGLNADNFGSIMGAIGETSVSTESQIERLRQMFGVNYTGATRLLKLYQDNGGNVNQEQIDKVLAAPENKNKETQYQQAVNDIKDAVVRIGSKAADIKIEGMSLVSNNVARLANQLVGTGTNSAIGLGTEALKETNTKVNDGTNPEFGDDALRGLKAQAGDFDTKQLWRNDKKGIDEYLRMGYGDLLLELSGQDQSKVNDFLQQIYDAKKSGDVSSLRGVVVDETSDGRSMKAERDDESEYHATYWIKKLYQMFEKGITLQ